jgi:8-oxo-dGTP pyrophosphatase MutT (NUDIX family)
MANTYLSTLANWTRDIREGRVSEQAGALCSRVNEAGETQILLLTSRDTKRWVLPKGNIEKKETSRDAAAREAFEEAGVRGKVSKRPIGLYTYLKVREGAVCVVTVHHIAVDEIARKFHENKVRQFEWMSVWEAARRVLEPELKSLIGLLG